MWRLLSIDDPKIEEYAQMRNDVGCTADFSADLMQRNMIRNKEYFIYEDDTYTILLGFAYDHSFEMMQYIAFAIKPKYNAESFRIIAEKTKEYLEEHQCDLVVHWESLMINKMAIDLESEIDLMDMIRVALRGVGLKTIRDYETKKGFVMRNNN